MPKKHRAYWKGYPRLSLATSGVEGLHAIESASDISSRQIHKRIGRRINYEKVVPGVGDGYLASSSRPRLLSRTRLSLSAAPLMACSTVSALWVTA